MEGDRTILIQSCLRAHGRAGLSKIFNQNPLSYYLVAVFTGLHWHCPISSPQKSSTQNPNPNSQKSMDYGSKEQERRPHYSSAPALNPTPALAPTPTPTLAPTPAPLPQHYAAPPSTIHQPYHQLTPSYYYPNPHPHPNPNPNHIIPPSNAIPAYDTADAGISYCTPPVNPYAPHGGYSYPPLGPTPLSHYYGARSGVGEGDPHGFSGKEAIRQYGIDPAVYSIRYAPAPPRPYDGPYDGPVPYGTRSAFIPHKNANYYPGGAKRGTKKMTKVVQSAYCEVCKADCTSQLDLNNHKQGKRHLKNLQKLQDSITPKSQKLPLTTDVVEGNESVGDDSKGKAVVVEEKKRKEAPEAISEDLETKKRKMLECGATPDGVRVCTVCNIVVNSQKVYDFHIAGQKHIAMAMTKQQQQEVAAS